jgi:hypothetical protein
MLRFVDHGKFKLLNVLLCSLDVVFNYVSLPSPQHIVISGYVAVAHVLVHALERKQVRQRGRGSIPATK